MKRSRFLLSLVCLIMLLASIFILTACVVIRDNDNEQPIFMFNNNGAIAGLTTHGKTLTEIVVPEEIDGKKVISIGSRAFEYCSSLESVTIGNNVTSIGERAFDGCKSLKSIVIGKNISKISDDAFNNCIKLVEVINNSPYITIEKGSTANGNLGYYALSVFNSGDTYVNKFSTDSDGYVTYTDGEDKILVNYVGSQTELTLPSDITKINNYAFYNNDKILCIVIPNSVTSIGEEAFSYCDSLTSIVIPDSVTSIGDYAFYGCSSLTKVNYLGTIDSWAQIEFGSSYSNPIYYAKNLYINDVLVSEAILTTATKISDYAFYNCSSLTSIKTPNSVMSIGDYSFNGCDSLTSVTIGNGITSIGGSAFNGCTSLTSVTISNSVTSIGSSAFNGCSSLTSVTFEGNSQLTSIGSYAFKDCESLESIVISNSVTSIGFSAFRGCSSLTEITLSFVGATLNGTSNTHFGYIFGASSYNSNSTYVPSSLKKVIITGDTSIYSYAFDGCSSLTSVTIGNNVTSIGDRAFDGCSSLTSVTIGNSVANIGSSAFYNCSSLTKVNYLGTIDGWAQIEFDSANSNPLYYAEGLYINDSLFDFANLELTTATKISNYAFYNCSSLTSIKIPNSVMSIGDYSFNGCDSLTSITIGNGITSIGSSAFNGCTSLTSVTIPNSVTSIGSSAFNGCTSLKEITLPFVGASIYANVYFGYIFGASSYNSNSTYVPSSLKKVIITGDTSIYSYAFDGCSSLTSVTIGNNVTSIGDRAFYNCSSLTSVTIGNNVTSIGVRAFRGCSSLKSITLPFIVPYLGYMFASGVFVDVSTNIDDIPSSLETVIITGGNVGDDAFRGCSSLKNVEISNTVTSIGDYSFNGCDSLTSITIGNGITSIGSSAFDGCSSLTSVTFEENSKLESIGEYAFYNCTSLAKVNYTGTIDQWAQIEFSSSTSNPIGYTKSLYINDTLITEAILNTATKISSYAFYNCTSLTSIVIPDSVTSIGGGAFNGCTSLKKVNYLGTIDGWAQIEFYDTNISNSYSHYEYYENSNPASYAKDLYINNQLVKEVKLSTATKVNNGAFMSCDSITKVEIPNSVTSIGEWAFLGCSKLTSVAIPDSVTRIGCGVFYNCNSLRNVEIPDSVTRISYYAFTGCSSLTSIMIPNGVTYIGSGAFSGCSSLTSIIIPNSNIYSNAFSGCDSLTSVTIGNGVSSISNRAFEGCSKLTSVTFSDTSNWYMTRNSSDWNNKTGGKPVDVTSASRNATYLKSRYYDYFWYKK